MITIVLALLAAATNATSSVLQRVANAKEAASHRSGGAALLHLLSRPVWLGGIAAVILSFLLQAAALDTGELSEVQPLMSLELPMTLLLASRVFGRRLRSRDWLAIIAMTGGMALFLFALQPGGGDPARPGGLAWALVGGVTGGVVVLLSLASWRASGARRAALLGTASGVSFALTAVFMSAALAQGLSWGLFGRWQTYLVGVAGIVAMLLLQEGLQAGTLVAVQPGVTLSDPVVSVVLGVVLFAEDVRTGGWIALEVLAAAVIAWGAMGLSRSPVADAGEQEEEAVSGEDSCGRPRDGREGGENPRPGWDRSSQRHPADAAIREQP